MSFAEAHSHKNTKPLVTKMDQKKPKSDKFTFGTLITTRAINYVVIDLRHQYGISVTQVQLSLWVKCPLEQGETTAFTG